jgi:hypothetical protein
MRARRRFVAAILGMATLVPAPDVEATVSRPLIG